MDIDGLMNYGAMGIVLAYFIWKDNSTMKDLRLSLDALRETVLLFKAKHEDSE